MKNLQAAREALFAHLRREIRDQRVIEAMMRVPREAFVPSDAIHLAYQDIPLPIGEGQTISQPYIVAMMTEALQLSDTETVLEVGSGSGYQSAILAELAARVVSVERVAALAERARRTLDRLGYRNVAIHPAGPKLGWPDDAPYDGIIVTAAAPRVPQSLLDQLRDGGRLVIPVGSRYDQDLLVITKQGDKTATVNLGGCRFVPLIGDDAWSEPDPAAY